MEISLSVTYWVLWTLVWFSFALVLFATYSLVMASGDAEKEKLTNINQTFRFIIAFGILGIFSLLLLHTLGLA